MIKVSIFIACYNEEIILPHTIAHYKKYIPSAEFIIFNNYSTDGTADLAESFGCRVVYWNTNNEIDEFKLVELKNNCWKHIQEGWVVVCDADEWLCVDEKAIKEEDKKGSTILSTYGVDIIAESKSSILNDLNLHIQSKAIKNDHFNKNICFKPSQIKDINYEVGAHGCSPFGNVIYGSTYLLKHMNWMGLRYKLSKNKIRYERSERMRNLGLDIHYKKNEQDIVNKFNDILKNSKDISKACDCFK
jgi:glycosyltransferase involved in cell wall biosynthesis